MFEIQSSKLSEDSVVLQPSDYKPISEKCASNASLKQSEGM